MKREVKKKSFDCKYRELGKEREREFWWSARCMKVVWKGRIAIQVTKGHTQRAFINSTIGNDNDTVNIYIYVGTLTMKIQRHICFNTIVTQRLLLLHASKFSILPSLVSSSFSLFPFLLSNHTDGYFRQRIKLSRLCMYLLRKQIYLQPSADCSFVCESGPLVPPGVNEFI